MIFTEIKKPLPGTTGMIHFQSISGDPITEEQAQEAQSAHGYLPAGYGFSNFVCQKTPDGHYQARWNCSNSCD